MPMARSIEIIVFVFFVAALAVTPAVHAQGSTVEALSQMEDLVKQNREQQQRLDELERKILRLESDSKGKSSHDGHGHEDEKAERRIDISLDALMAAGGSTEDDRSLQTLQGGGHDPRKRGFTVQNVELSLSGRADRYLSGETHIIFFLEPLTGETVVELEEAFLTLDALPYWLELEAGHFYTEFGIVNPQHPHLWDWQDQPVINTRFFGPDGMRGPGIRFGLGMPLPWRSKLHLGMQNAEGETMASFLANDEFFEERPIGNRAFIERQVHGLEDFVYLARLENRWRITDSLMAKLGFSGLSGPNTAGEETDTAIYGADLFLRWRPQENKEGWPFLSFQGEIMRREYETASQSVETQAGDVLELGGTLRDWGFYSQILYGFTPGWSAGFRYEYATAEGDSAGGRENDPFRDDRHRLSPLIAWHPSHFSRLRLQYNYDRADHLAKQDAHSVWLGVEFLYGSHGEHE